MEAPCLLGYGTSIAQVYSQYFVFCLPCSSCQLDAIVGWSNSTEIQGRGFKPMVNKTRQTLESLTYLSMPSARNDGEKECNFCWMSSKSDIQTSKIEETFRSSSTQIISRTCFVHIITLAVYGDSHHPESGFMCWAQLNWQWRTY